jgi:hypothetical protein
MGMDLDTVKKVSLRRADIYLHRTSDGMYHSYALLRFGRHIDRTVDSYEGFNYDEARASSNELWTTYR